MHTRAHTYLYNPVCKTLLKSPNRLRSLNRPSNTVISCFGGSFFTPSCLPILPALVAKPRTGDLFLGVPMGVPTGLLDADVGRDRFLGESEMLRLVSTQDAFLDRIEAGERAALRYAVCEAILSMCGLPGMQSSGL